MFHAFSGDKNDIRFLSGFDVYFSLNAAHAAKFPDLLANIPPDRLLFDSDAPFMRPKDGLCVSPRPQNAPANISLTVRSAAEILKTPQKELEERTTANARRFLACLKEKNDD